MKNVHERERQARLLESEKLFTNPSVRKIKPNGLSKEDFIRLAMSNEIVSSVRLGKDYFDSLLYSGKIVASPTEDLLFIPSSEARVQANLEEEIEREAKDVLNKIANAKTERL